MATSQRPLDAALAWFRRGDVERSLHELRLLLAASPGDATLHNALGSVLAATGQYSLAIEGFTEALALRSDYVAARTNLGQAQLELGQLRAAHDSFLRSLGEPSAPIQATLGLARVACLLGRFAEADAAFERALAGPDVHANAVSQRCYAALFDPSSSAARVIAAHEASVALLPPRVCVQYPSRARTKLVLGYLSPHFREHSIASFMQGILAAHDRTRVELRLYSDARQPDRTTERFATMVDGFHVTWQLSHAELAALCREHRVDVLIDLSGHMQPSRVPALGLAPAPVVLGYLGYPGSTGLPWLSGRFSDVWADPEDDPRLVGPEPVLRIQGGYFAYTPPQDAPEPAPLPAASTHCITFGSFNDALKLNDSILQTWAELLSRCDAKLLLKTRALAWPEMRERVLDVFTRRGIDPARVELLAATATRREHLELYSRMDIALDTFPYNGATTTCEALYMGVPVVTCAGDRHSARMGASILTAAGLGEWIAPSPAEYIQLALNAVADRPRLSQLRQTLRQRIQRSALCDARRVASAIEDHAARMLR